MRLFLSCLVSLIACQHHTTDPDPDASYDGPMHVVPAPGSESTYGQCHGEYNLDVSQKQVDFNQFVEADYDNAGRGRLIMKGDSGQFMGCLLNRDQCDPPNVVHTYKSGLQVCVETQHCCTLSLP